MKACQAKRVYIRIQVILLTLMFSNISMAERVGDLAEFIGVRSNPLMGYGIVVGLDGSGDQTTQTPFTGQSIQNMLSQLGITVPRGVNMQLKNVAAVVVTTELPPFARPGQSLNLVVSSIGNAKSLRGGTLLMTPLKGIDGEVYAIAQGNVLVVGAGAESGGSSTQINQLAVGRIPSGGVAERAVNLSLGDSEGYLELQLNEASFSNAESAVSSINRAFGTNVAKALNGGVIRLQGPLDSNSLVNFMAKVENVDVQLSKPRSRVVINSRTGSVVLNDSVTLLPAAVAHGNLSIVIDTSFGVSQPAAFGQGDTVVVPDSDISIDQGSGGLNFVEGANLMEVINRLNSLGASAQDLMSILEALKASGSLRADLEII